MADNEPQKIENPLAKKGQFVKAGLEGATDWRVLAAGGVAGFFMAGGNIPAGMAVASAINAAVSVKKEHDEVQNEIVSSADQTKNDKINWGAAGLTAGVVATALPIVGWGAVPVIAVASHFVGEHLKSSEEKELRTQQAALAAEETTNAYNAGAMGSAMNDNSDIIGSNTAVHRSLKVGGENTQQRMIRQRAEREQREQAQIAGIG